MVSHTTTNYLDNGTETIGGTENVTGTLNDTGVFQIGSVTVTSTAAELNTLHSVTAGTAAASSAVVLDSNKNVTGMTVTDLINNGTKRSTAQVDVTSSTALVAVTGLSVPLTAGGTYAIEAYVPGTSGASGGMKVSLDTSDTLTATSFSLHGYFMAAAAMATATTTSLGTGIGSTSAAIAVELQGIIVVNAAGTLILKFAQNASNGTTSSAYVNGYLKVTRIA